MAWHQQALTVKDFLLLEWTFQSVGWDYKLHLLHKNRWIFFYHHKTWWFYARVTQQYGINIPQLEGHDHNCFYNTVLTKNFSLSSSIQARRIGNLTILLLVVRNASQKKICARSCITTLMPTKCFHYAKSITVSTDQQTQESLTLINLHSIKGLLYANIVDTFHHC